MNKKYHCKYIYVFIIYYYFPKMIINVIQKNMKILFWLLYFDYLVIYLSNKQYILYMMNCFKLYLKFFLWKFVSIVSKKKRKFVSININCQYVTLKQLILQKGLYNLNVVIHLKESSMQSASMQPYIQAQHMHIHHTLSDLISVHICSTTRLSAEESQLHSDIKGILAAETS